MESEGHTRRLLGVILCAALVLRLAAALLFHPPLFSDDIDYVSLGRSIAGGHGYLLEGHETAYRPPGYPILLAGAFRAFGDSLLPVRILQALADTISCLLIFAIARRLFSDRAGLIAAGIFAFFPVAILYVPILMTETVFTTLLLLYLYIALAGPHSWKRSLAEGILIGFATLIRPTILLLPLVVFAIRALEGWRAADNLRQIALTAVAALVVLSPWLARNEVLFGRMALTSNTGVNFWMGSHEGASGSYSFPAGNPLSLVADEFERSDLGMRLGMRFIREHPLQYGMILFKKWAHFFSTDYWLLLSLDYQSDLHTAPSAGAVFSRFSAAEVLVVQAPFATVLLLAAFGFCCSAPGDSRRTLSLLLPCVYWLIVHLVFYAAARYRFPVVPLLIIGSAYSVDLALKHAPVRTRARMAVFWALTALFAAGWIAERVVIARQASFDAPQDTPRGVIAAETAGASDSGAANRHAARLHRSPRCL